jgi:arginine/lysine/ornithine decarboxylase
MDKQKRLPIYEALLEHSNNKPISFHVPGHKYGEILPKEAKDLFQHLLKLDATELSGLDDLHSPEGVIREAEELLADLYQVQKSFFLINGSTVGNLAMIMSTATTDDIVLVQRNCHKSVLHALKLAGVRPVFLEPEYDTGWKASTGVSVKTVKVALASYPEAKAIILTYPNYYGMIYDLKSVIELAHSYHLPVLVDEAHGAHFIIGNPFPASAIELGADIVVQSAHKTLPAMTMGSFLHVNSNRINLDKLKDYLQMLQSSSPSYVIMASLDVARNYLAAYEYKDIQYLLKEKEQFRAKLARLPAIKVLDYPNSAGDPLKVTIQTRGKWSGYELQKKFEMVGIYTELADLENVLIILPLLKENQAYPLAKAIEKMEAVLTGEPPVFKVEKEFQMNSSKVTELAIPFHSMGSYEKMNVSFPMALGQVCAEDVIPYPPGIPLLLTGELISEDKLEQLNLLIKSGARFQGGALLDKGLLTIFST